MMAALRNKRFLICGAMGVLFLLVLMVSLVLHLQRYHALRVAQTAANGELAALRNAVSGVDTTKLKADNDALAAELSEIERSLPEREYLPTFIKQIESGAAITGNDLLELRRGEIRKGLSTATPATGAAAETPTPEQATGATSGAAGAGEAAAPAGGGLRYSEMDIDVRLEGSYIGAFEFMRHLGKIGKIIAVKEIEIERSATRSVRPDGRAVTTIRLGCKAYILEPASGFPGDITIRIL